MKNSQELFKKVKQGQGHEFKNREWIKSNSSAKSKGIKIDAKNYNYLFNFWLLL